MRDECGVEEGVADGSLAGRMQDEPGTAPVSRWAGVVLVDVCGGDPAGDEFQSRAPSVRKDGRGTRTTDMGSVIVDITMSLDGFVTAPNDGPDQGLGETRVRSFISGVFGGLWQGDEET